MAEPYTFDYSVISGHHTDDGSGAKGRRAAPLVISILQGGNDGEAESGDGHNNRHAAPPMLAAPGALRDCNFDAAPPYQGTTTYSSVTHVRHNVYDYRADGGDDGGGGGGSAAAAAASANAVHRGNSSPAARNGEERKSNVHDTRDSRERQRAESFEYSLQPSLPLARPQPLSQPHRWSTAKGQMRDESVSSLSVPEKPTLSQPSNPPSTSQRSLHERRSLAFSAKRISDP